MTKVCWPIVGFLFVSAFCSAQDDSHRTWHIAGKKIDATFKSIGNGKLLFEDGTGSEITASFEDLPLDEQQAVVEAAAWGRVWTDATGKHSTVAELIAVVKNKAVLEKLGGSRKTVPIERLSIADREYVEKFTRTVAAAELSKLHRDKEEAAAKIEFDAASKAFHELHKEFMAAVQQANDAMKPVLEAMLDKARAQNNAERFDQRTVDSADQAYHDENKEVERIDKELDQASQRFKAASNRYRAALNAGREPSTEDLDRVKNISNPEERDTATNQMEGAVHVYREAQSLMRWYEGGTLKYASAAIWQNAPTTDKLATCGFFINQKWTTGKLKQSISINITSVDDLKPFAAELVDMLDKEYKPNPDIAENSKLFSGEIVSDVIETAMQSKGWLQ